MCYVNVHRCVCITMCVLYTCMSVGAVCVCLHLHDVYVWAVCTLSAGAMFVLWGSVCMLCNAHVCLWEHLLLCISVTVEGSACFCVLNACICVCGGSVCVMYMYTRVVCGQ